MLYFAAQFQGEDIMGGRFGPSQTAMQLLGEDEAEEEEPVWTVFEEELCHMAELLGH